MKIDNILSLPFLTKTHLEVISIDLYTNYL